MLTEPQLRKLIILENEKNRAILDEQDQKLHKAFVMGLECALDD